MGKESSTISDIAIRAIDRTVAAAGELSEISPEKIGKILIDTASALENESDLICRSNKEDLDRMDPADPRHDRLRLDPERIAAIAADMRNVASLPSPVGHTLAQWTRPNGMTISKMSVPFGVVGVIYEARPNVTCDVFSLCLRSGNASLLKGGSDARATNETLAAIIRQSLADHRLNPDTCTLLPSEREATSVMMKAVGKVDVIIPRGSASLINFVRENSLVPVIETGAGICHTYFDRDGDTAIGRQVINNAKTRRVSVCNALDCLIIHRDRLSDLAELCSLLPEHHVIIYADSEAYEALAGKYPAGLLQHATEADFGTEFLDYKMSVRTVTSLDEAISHIAQYGSRHSECIISRSKERIVKFERRVDAACVYANVSTAFTDGAQFGFGAEIGISTQKLHARGPMALPELTTYKYLIEGEGQIRTP